MRPSSARRQALRGRYRTGPASQDGAALASAILADSEWVGVIETVPNAVIMGPAVQVRNTALTVGLIAVLFAAALAVLIARSLTRPIVQLTQAVEGIGRGGTATIPIDATGETGVLARAFARMVAESTDKTAALEREVEEHRRTEAARDHHAERERLFSAAVESSNDAIVTKSLDGTITGWNSAAERLYGYYRRGSGRKEDRAHRSARPAERGAMTPCAGSAGARRSSTTRRSACARTAASVEVSLSISPIKAPSGAIIGISKVARDITETNRTQLALRQQIEERRRIFETSQDLILIIEFARHPGPGQPELRKPSSATGRTR